MDGLRVSLFGEVQMTGRNGSSEEKLTPVVGVLLSYLLIYRHRCHPREVLATLFWSEYSEEQARRCLSTALWRLRRVLEPPGSLRGTYLITTTTGNVGFNCESDYWLDVEAFERPVSRILARSGQVIDAAEAEELERALQFHKNDLLDGFYDDWILRERERLRILYLNSLVQLMHYHRDRRNYEKSLAYGRQILEHDPLREEIHRDMMRLYLESGQQALAVRQYEIGAQALLDELGIQPMEETQRLYAEIIGKANQHLSTNTLNDPTAGYAQMLQQLRTTLQGVDVVREQLRQMIQLTEQLAKRND